MRQRAGVYRPSGGEGTSDLLSFDICMCLPRVVWLVAHRFGPSCFVHADEREGLKVSVDDASVVFSACGPQGHRSEYVCDHHGLLLGVVGGGPSDC